MRYGMWTLAVVFVAAAGWMMNRGHAAEGEGNGLTASAQTASAQTAWDFKLKDMADKDVSLGKYRGKVVLLVNTASKCGHTPQYKALQDLHAKYAERGLVVLGIPSNDFGNQEPGTHEQIVEFCSSKFGVEFTLMGKAVVKGEKKVPLYAWLTTQGADPGEVKWNFEKFLVSADGQVAARWRSRIKPDDAQVVRAIEAELAKLAATTRPAATE